MDSGSILPSSVEIDFRRIPTTNLRTPTGSIIPHILLWVVQLVALASNPFRGRGTLFAGAIICLAILSQINPHFTNNIALAQPFTIGWSNYLSTLEKLLFCAEGKPEASFWHVDKPAQEALSFPGFGYRKIRWALVIILNMRGIRWNYQVKNIPKANLRSRSAFVVSQIYNIMYYGLMADLVIHLGIRFFFTAGDGQVGVLNSKYLTLRHPDWRWSFVKALVFGASPYYVCCLQYTMFSVPAVLLGLSKPEVSSQHVFRPPSSISILTPIHHRTGHPSSEVSKTRLRCGGSGGNIGIRRSARSVILASAYPVPSRFLSSCLYSSGSS